MQRNGYIRLHRSMTDWEWYQDANTMRLWIHLLLTVNWRDAKFCGVSVPRGSRVCSLSTLSAESGLSVRATRTALEHLKSTRNVTSTTYPKFTVISIKNYDQYQTDDKVSDKRATSERQASDNKLKREKGKKSSSGSSSAPARVRTCVENQTLYQEAAELAQNNWDREATDYEIRTAIELIRNVTGEDGDPDDQQALLTALIEAACTASRKVSYLRGVARRWTDAGIHTYQDYVSWLSKQHDSRGKPRINKDKTYDLEDFFQAAVERTKRKRGNEK